MPHKRTSRTPRRAQIKIKTPKGVGSVLNKRSGGSFVSMSKIKKTKR